MDHQMNYSGVDHSYGQRGPREGIKRLQQRGVWGREVPPQGCGVKDHEKGGVV